MHRLSGGGGNWDDLRFVLAVAEAGSVSGAARALGVNHATVLRRIAAFEAAEGTPVFDRTPTGYVVPPDRLRVIEAAREAAIAMEAVSRSIRAAGAPPSQVVRVTSTDSFCQHVLPPLIAALATGAQPQRVELLCTNSHVDLARMTADVTVRPTMRLPDDLAGEAAGVLGFGAYGTPGVSGPWLGLLGTLSRAAAADWMRRTLHEDEIRGGADSFLVLRELVAAGMGCCFLPCFLGDHDPRLTRHPDPDAVLQVPIWVASHADLAGSPRLRAVRQHLARGLLAQADRLAGRRTG